MRIDESEDDILVRTLSVVNPPKKLKVNLTGPFSCCGSYHRISPKALKVIHSLIVTSVDVIEAFLIGGQMILGVNVA